MDDEQKKLMEGEQTDGLEGTSPSDEGASPVGLNSSPEPTPQEMEDAGIEPAPESDGVVAQGTGDAAPEAETVTAGADEPPAEMPTERTFTQSQVNDLVGRTRMETREQTFRAVYGRYGVEDEAGMDELVGTAQRYDTLRGEYDEARKGWEEADAARNGELATLKESIALLQSGIDRDRYDDAKAIIKSKGMEVTVESIESLLATHPEWKKANGSEPNPNFRPDPAGSPAPTQSGSPESTIRVLGNEGAPNSDGMSEEEYAMKKLFKF